MNCAQCTVFSDSVCGWCGKSEDCQPLKNTSATCGAIATTCPCSLNRNCDSCLQDFNALENNVHVECQWCHPAQSQGNRSFTQCVSKGSCSVNHTIPLNCPALCSTQTDCRSCQFHGCAFCENTGACVDPDNVGDGRCFVAHTCPRDDCESIGACDVCRRSQCVWCTDHQVCTALNSTTARACTSRGECSAECTAMKSCDACAGKTGCGWCKFNDTTSCIDVGLHKCEGTMVACGGFDVGAFFIGWLVFALILGVIAGGFYVYRKRSGRPVYTSI